MIWIKIYELFHFFLVKYKIFIGQQFYSPLVGRIPPWLLTGGSPHTKGRVSSRGIHWLQDWGFTAGFRRKGKSQVLLTPWPSVPHTPWDRGTPVDPGPDHRQESRLLVGQKLHSLIGQSAESLKWWNRWITNFDKLWCLQQFRMLGMISTAFGVFFFWSFWLATAFFQPLILSYFWENLSVQLILRSNLDVVYFSYWGLFTFSISDACDSSCLLLFVCGSLVRWVAWNISKNVTPFSCVIVYVWFRNTLSSVQLSRSVVSDSETPWIAACQASLSITNTQSLLKLMSIKSVMPSSHLILCRPLLVLPPIPPSIRVFSDE